MIQIDDKYMKQMYKYTYIDIDDVGSILIHKMQTYSSLMRVLLFLSNQFQST